MTSIVLRYLVVMRELVQTAESFTREFKFDYSTIIWKEDGHFFRSTLPERILLRKSVDIDNLPISEPIPIHLIRGLWHNGLTEVSNTPSDYFVKVPALLSYDTLPLGEITAAEADICEILKRNPHKNICVYYGCTREGEYIGGLCFKRYRRNLYHEMESGGPLDRRAVIDGITEGVTFLHSLGLIHNDLDPGNIMLEDDGTPVIIDFDSCRRDGEPMGIKKGTPGWSAGWTKKPSSIARKANDFYSLKLL